MIAPPETVAAPIVTGAAVGQNRLGPVKDSKSIVVVAAVALPTPTVSAKLAVRMASAATRETLIVTPFPRRPVRPGSVSGAETSLDRYTSPERNPAPSAPRFALTPREICRSNAYRTGQELPPRYWIVPSL